MKDEWSDRQKKIYEGLSAIGQEIAGFYKAALNFYSGDCPNAAYFLLHAAREIDGGLRDVLHIDDAPEKGEKNGHKKSILTSLGIKEFEGLARDWFEVSNKFHMYAHRRGAWKAPRPLAEVTPLWDQYERILERLVGSYYAIIERIERISKIKNLTSDVVETLFNILTIPTYYNYFFRTEKSVDWFLKLKTKGYFSPEHIQFDDQNNALFWNVLDYMERVSEQVKDSFQYCKELLDIVEDIYQFSLKKPIVNIHIWWYCSKILYNIPFDIIKQNLSAEQFRSWFSVWAEYSSLVISDVGLKLLPKFLNEDGAVEYAEAIIDVLTEFHAGERPVIERPDTITSRKNALLELDNYWVLEAFEKNPQIGGKCSLAAIFNIADKLKRIIEFQQQIQYDVTSIGDDVYRIEVSRVTEEGITDEMGFKDGVFDCVVKQFSADQLKGVDRQSLYTLHNTSPEITRSDTFRIVAPNQGEFLSKIIKMLPKTIKWESADNFKEKMELLFDHLHSDFSYIHFKSLQNIDRNFVHSAEEVLTVILKEMIISKCEAKREEGKELLVAFLSEKYPFPIFRRFALLCIDKLWSDYNELLDRFFTLIPTVLDKPAFEVELYDLLNNHNREFKKPLLEKLKQLISAVPEYYIKKGEKLSAYWQFKWLSPLKNNHAFSDWYKEIEQKMEPKVDKPYAPERSTITMSWSGSKSPLTSAEILKMPVVDIVEYLNNFKGVDRFKNFFDDAPDKEGLAGALFEAVKENPQKIVNEIDKFYGVEDFYLIHLFRGIREAWKANKIFDWEKLFDFFIKLNTQTQAENENNKRDEWLISEIVGLIEDGCSNEAHAFDPRYFEKADKTFNLIIPTLKGEEKPDIERDALMYAMNTTQGRTIMAFVVFSLRVARVVKKNDDVWSKDWIKDWGKNKYEKFFSKGIEAYIWLGGYLPQIKYLNEQYAKSKIDEFNKIDTADFNCRMFMEGYLHGGSVYDDLYKLMRSNCLRALNKEDFNEEINHRLVEYCCLGYLHFKESLEEKNGDGQESMFWKMLFGKDAFNKKERWLKVVGYFGSHGVSKKAFNDKIISFWKWTYDNSEKVKTILGNDYNSFLGKMSVLVNILDKIDDERKNWLILCAPYVDLHHNAMFFMEYLTKFDDADSIKHIGEIFRKVLENTTPQFMAENVTKVVRNIYEKGNRNDADEICNTYGRRGVHFLRPLWEEFQNKPPKQ